MKKLTLMAMALTVSLCSAANAASDLSAEVEALKAQVKQQQVELQQLRVQSSSSWMNERRSQEVKALVQQVLADADTRAALAEGGMTAGHNGENFFLASEDGSFLLRISGQIQIRHTSNFRDRKPFDADGNPATLDETSFVSDAGLAGFENRRTKIRFDGHIGGPRVHYVVQLAVQPDDNEVNGDIITIGYDLTDNLYIWAGEDKGPFLREEIVSSSRQLAAERSLVNEVFSLGVQQGVGLNWQAREDILLSLMISDGANSGEEDRRSKAWDSDLNDFAFTARLDWTFEGDPGEAADFTSDPTDELFIHGGAAVHYEVTETGNYNGRADPNSGAPYNDTFTMWTLDAAVEYQGFNAFIAFVMMHTDFEGAGSALPAGASRPDFDPWGLVVQAGYNMDIGDNGTLEPFVRWEHLDFDSVAETVNSGYDDEIDLITFGFNWYHKKHASKFTLDVVWALDTLPGGSPIASPGGQAQLLRGVSSGLGLLGDDPDEDGQIALRAQYQLLF